MNVRQFSLIFAMLAISVQAADEPIKLEMTPLAAMPAGHYVADPAHTSITFKVNHLGLSNYTARFVQPRIDLELDPKTPTRSTVKSVIDATSLRTDFPQADVTDFDKQLAEGTEWFNGKTYPTLTFTSTRLETTGDGTGILTGNLTMLGQTHPVTLIVRLNGAMANMPHLNVPVIGFSATGQLQRSIWGLNGGLPMVGDTVSFVIETELRKAP